VLRVSRLIVLEGLDGSGKATQTRHIHRALQERGESVRKISFPDYESPSSSLIKMYLGGEFGADPRAVNPYQASVFYAVDRVASYLKDWKKDYAAGQTILTDRYTTSNAIYQLSKMEESRREDYLRWLEELEYKKLALPKPDVVLYLDVEPEVSQHLLSKRYSGDQAKKDIHERDLSFLLTCREAALYAARHGNWIVVRCSHEGKMNSEDSITREILSHI